MMHETRISPLAVAAAAGLSIAVSVGTARAQQPAHPPPAAAPEPHAAGEAGPHAAGEAGPHAAGEAGPHAAGEGHGEHGGAHEHHNHYFVGANGMVLAAFSKEPTEVKFGGGAFFEFTVVPNWLEIEIGVHVLKAPEKLELPIDVLLKKPFHVNHWFHPYVGLGPTIVPEFVAANEKEGKAARTELDGGVAIVAGSYFWLHPHVGLSLEINNNILFAHGIIDEFGGSGGVVFGW
jgi:hypothetical protein